MKKSIVIYYIITSIVVSLQWWYAQKINTFEPMYQHETVYSTSLDHIIITSGIDDPIRSWASYVIQYISGTWYTGNIDTFEKSSYITLTFLSTIINRFLWLLAFIALLYLLYHAFMVLISHNNPEKISQHRQALYTALIVIVGIGLSWVIVSAMFYIIAIITS